MSQPAAAVPPINVCVCVWERECVFVCEGVCVCVIHLEISMHCNAEPSLQTLDWRSKTRKTFLLKLEISFITYM